MDLHNLGDVLHYEEPEHVALPVEAEPVSLRFIPPRLPSFV
jgi:hypothetical protein